MIGAFFGGMVVVGLAILIVEGLRRQRRRRNSLRRSDDGTMWYRIGLDGTPRRSPRKPVEPGGDWHNESGTSGTDGGGGDSGGD